MKLVRQLLAVSVVLVMMLCFLCITGSAQSIALAEEQGATRTTMEYRYPEGVIEVPMGTRISISEEENYVTIAECPVKIQQGDTFVVYLQELPVGYTAKEVAVNRTDTVISVEKASTDIYQYLEIEGDVHVIGDMVHMLSVDAPLSEQGGLKPIVRYDESTGTVIFTLNVLDATDSDGQMSFRGSISAELSNMHLHFSTYDGVLDLTFSGNWNFSASQSISKSFLPTLPAFKMRIAGVGVVSAGVFMEASGKGTVDVGGTFGITVKTGDTILPEISKDFTTTKRNVSMEGGIRAGVKLSAGVDVLVASADLYAEVGMLSEVKMDYHLFPDDPNKDDIQCINIRIYYYMDAGASARLFYIDAGDERKINQKEWKTPSAKQEALFSDIHLENGQPVRSCTQGDEIETRDDPGMSGVTFDSTLFTDDRIRAVETDVVVPWDTVVNKDFYLNGGTLNLNGKSVEVNGDFIHTGGTLVIGSGKLVIHGDYRMQKLVETEEWGTFATDSKGVLDMNNSKGTIVIDGDLIIQSTAENNRANSGRIEIGGDIYLKKPFDGHSQFVTGTGLGFVMLQEQHHTIYFTDTEHNAIGCVALHNTLTVQGDARIGRIDMNGHNVVVNGLLDMYSSIEMQDVSTVNDIFESGDFNLSSDASVKSDSLLRGMNLNGYSLKVNGDMRINGDVNLDGGKLNVTGSVFHELGSVYIDNGQLLIDGGYYIVGTGSRIDAQNEDYTNSLGNLKMRNAADVVRVGGDVVVYTCGYSWSEMELGDGKLYIGGNIKQIGNSDKIREYSADSFNCGEKHKTIFTNPDSVTIDIEGNICGFGQLEIVAKKVTMNGYVSCYTLLSDLDDVTAENLKINRKMDLNGHRLNIQGDLQIGAESYGMLDVHGGQVNVSRNLTISNGALDLDGTELTVADLTQYNGTLDINRGTLNIIGDINQRGGEVIPHEGTINVNGSYYILGEDSRVEGANKTYTCSNGKLKMRNAADVVRVGGDVVVYTCGYSWSEMELGDGKLYIGGNLKQIGNSDKIREYSADSFNCGEKHKTIFTNPDSVTIDIEGNICGFGQLEIVAKKVTMNGYVSCRTLLSDLNDVTTNNFRMNRATDLNGHRLVINGNLLVDNRLNLNAGYLEVNGDVQLTDMLDLDGKELVIHGNLIQTNGTLEMDCGDMTVSGNVYVQGGTVKFMGGRLRVAGGYYIVGADSRMEGGNESYTPSYGRLEMTTVNDELDVGGDFIIKSNQQSTLNAGGIYVAGMFRQCGTSTDMSNSDGYYRNFRPSGTHKVILNGEGFQYVYFASSESYFNLMEVTKPIVMYSFNPDPCWLGAMQVRDMAHVFTMPAATTVIEEEAFIGNTDIWTLEAPDGLQRIESGAFRDCNNLMEFAVPESVVFIASDAFEGCNKLMLIVSSDYGEEYARTNGIMYSRVG